MLLFSCFNNTLFDCLAIEFVIFFGKVLFFIIIEDDNLSLSNLEYITLVRFCFEVDVLIPILDSLFIAIVYDSLLVS